MSHTGQLQAFSTQAFEHRPTYAVMLAAWPAVGGSKPGRQQVCAGGEKHCWVVHHRGQHLHGDALCGAKAAITTAGPGTAAAAVAEVAACHRCQQCRGVEGGSQTELRTAAQVYNMLVAMQQPVPCFGLGPPSTCTQAA